MQHAELTGSLLTVQIKNALTLRTGFRVPMASLWNDESGIFRRVSDLTPSADYMWQKYTVCQMFCQILKCLSNGALRFVRKTSSKTCMQRGEWSSGIWSEDGERTQPEAVHIHSVYAHRNRVTCKVHLNGLFDCLMWRMGTSRSLHTCSTALHHLTCEARRGRSNEAQPAARVANAGSCRRRERTGLQSKRQPCKLQQ